jgi:plastocyanin
MNRLSIIDLTPKVQTVRTFRPSRTRSALLALGLLIVCFGTGCAALAGAHTIALNSDASVTVTARAMRQSFPASYPGFFPSSLQLRPGDAIRFENWSTSEPQVIAFGTLVDEAAAAVTALGARPRLAEVAALPQVKRLPAPFRRGTPTEAPTLDATAATPCLVTALGAEGAPVACSSSELGAFDGRAALYSSGILSQGEVFRVRLADDIRPGRYGFVDLANPEVAWGTLTVVGPKEDRPRPGAVKERGEDDLEAARRSLAGVAPGAAGATAERAIAGAPSNRGLDHLLTFGAGAYTAPPGATVTWQVFGLHSITFNPSEEAERGLLSGGEDEAFTVNGAAWAASPGVQVSSGPSPRDPAVTQVRLDGGAWDGKGPKSSGIVRAVPSAPVAYSLTFSAPGSYPYRCLVHPKMKGEVVIR